ncbi:hypothetical protein [Fibrella aestuarina]|nr:hypothetical protein [Fibrella aestuarina]
MRYLVHQLLNDNTEAIARRTLLNCHLPGLHSIVLVDQPGQRIRLFYKTAACRMEVDLHKGLLDLAIHPHHCNLSIEMVAGEMKHYVFERTDGFGVGIRLGEFAYQSAITQGVGKFTATGEAYLRLVEKRHITLGYEPCRNGVQLAADQLHTLSVGGFDRAMWLVIEGAEDPNYQPYSYAFDDLSQYDFSDLYVRPRPAEAARLFAEIKEQLDLSNVYVQRDLELTDPNRLYR